MRDDSQRWDAPRSPDMSLEMTGLRLDSIRLTRQTLLSGRQVRATSSLPIVAWPDIAPTQPYALSLRRDRLLLVGAPPMHEGWDATSGHAVSDMTDAYAVFDLSGPRAFSVLRRGTEIALDQPSKSVARLFSGMGTFIYRVAGDTFRLHVASPHRDALLKTLETFCTEAARHSDDSGG